MEWRDALARALTVGMNGPSTADVRNTLSSTVTNRGTFVPLADYADGSTRLAWPAALYEPAAAWNRMLQGDDSPGNALQVAGAAMAGSVPFARNPLPRMEPSPLGTIHGPKTKPSWMTEDASSLAAYGGHKSKSSGISEWDVHARSSKPSKTAEEIGLDTLARDQGPAVISALERMIGQPQSANVYHGSWHGDIIRNPHKGASGLWASTRPDIADTYTRSSLGDRGMVAPARASFERPLVVDAGGARYSRIPIPMPNGGTRTMSSDYLSLMARKLGADGLIIRDVRDSIDGGDIPSDIWHAIKPKTVQGRYSPEYIYSGGPGAAIAGALMQQPERQN